MIAARACADSDDYLCARIAVSSNDLRRMVPFRRRNEGKNVVLSNGYMNVSLLETAFGSDPMAQRFAILAGNTRAYRAGRSEPHLPWTIRTDGSNGNETVIDALSEYRIPASIHDLFTDLHRRFSSACTGRDRTMSTSPGAIATTTRSMLGLRAI